MTRKELINHRNNYQAQYSEKINEYIRNYPIKVGDKVKVIYGELEYSGIFGGFDTPGFLALPEPIIYKINKDGNASKIRIKLPTLFYAFIIEKV